MTSCSSDETTTKPLGPVAIEALRAEFESANCEWQVRCGGTPDKATCKIVDGADYPLVQLIADAGKGKAKYDGQAGRTWVEAVRNQACEIGDAVQKALKAAWEPVFTGTVAAGKSCLLDDECAGKSVCDKPGCGDTECCAGSCAPAPAPAAEGQPCDVTTACPDGTFCGVEDGSGGTGNGGAGGGGTGMTICKAKADNGQPCTDQVGCEDGQLCDVDGSHKCYKLSPDGQPCNPSLRFSCLSYDHWCDPAAGKCVELPGAGAPCAPTGEYCKHFAVCDSGTCKARPLDGQPCGGPGTCLGDLRCDMNTSVCKTLSPAQACFGDGMPPTGSGSGGGGAGGGG